MYSRFRTIRSTSGKWQRVPHTGVGSVTREQVGEWLVEVSHRRIGVAVKRDQYSVKISRPSSAYEESLQGFRTKDAALQAARKRIELLTHVRQPIAVPPPHRGRRSNPRLP